MFRVGQKVVCVDVSPRGGRQPRELTLNAVYTVTAMHIVSDGLGLELADVKSAMEMYFWPWFDAKRFRPAVERKTDIAVFTEILRNATKRKPATV